MKKSLFTLLVTVVFACSTDNGSIENPAENPSGTLLKTLKKFSSGTQEFQIDFEYDSSGNITKSSQIYSYGTKDTVNFMYDSNGKMIAFEQVTTDPFGDVINEMNNFNYQNANVVKICQEITPIDDFFAESRVDKIEFGYDSFGNVELYTHYDSMQAEFFDCDDVDGIDSTEMLEYDSNNNMVRYENSNNFFGATYLKYTYDNTNHPYASVKPAIYRKLLGFSTVNNIMTANEYNADTDELLGTVVFNYEFNSQNYPTKLTRTYTSGSISQTLVFEYSYY